MTRNLKIVGLAVMAVLAVSAVYASAASAALFHSEAQVTELTGEQKTQNVFTVNGGTVKCEIAKFAGKITATGGSGTNWTSETVTVHPTYETCTGFGQNVTINTGTEAAGCNYVLNANGTIDKIECAEGQKIVITGKTTGCTVTVGPQVKGTTAGTLVNPNVDYTNEGSKTTRDVLVTATVGNEGTAHTSGSISGVLYTSSGGACGASGNNGSYRGTVTVRGYSNPEHTVQVGVWVE